MKRSEHLNVVAGKYLDLMIGSSHIFVDAFSGVFTAVFCCLDGDGKIAYCYSDKGMYRVREDVAFEHWASRGFKYDEENNVVKQQ